MPVWLIPLIVQIGGKVIEMAFNAATKKAPVDQIKIFDKIAKKDKVLSQDMYPQIKETL
jgi:hypothetical protein